MAEQFLAGAAEIDITPPPGTLLMGSLTPKDRPASGVDDQLFVKALVLESGGKRLAYVSFDLCALERNFMEPMLDEASRVTGIPRERILWSCTHTHSGPVSVERICPSTDGELINREWFNSLPGKLIQCLSEADSRKHPARLCFSRAYCHSVAHHRRFRFKDKRQINGWLLNQGEDEVQCLGAAGPVDPEIGILTIESLDGAVQAILYNFAMHACSTGGAQIGTDYPGVVARELRNKFGSQTVVLYQAGACGNINPVTGRDFVGRQLAQAMVPAIEKRKPVPGPLRLDSIETVVTLPLRQPHPQEEERLIASQWQSNEQNFFRNSARDLIGSRQKNIETVVQAWRIGPFAFASIPGELFVEWGLKIKEESPFCWTFPVELAGDWIGYLITPEAWEAGGYECIRASTSRVSAQSVKVLVDTALRLLRELHERE